MNSEDRAEAIATTLIWLIGLALFAWCWQTSDSFVAALISTLVGGFFLVLLVGPLVAVVAFVLSLANRAQVPARNVAIGLPL